MSIASKLQVISENADRLSGDIGIFSSIPAEEGLEEGALNLREILVKVSLEEAEELLAELEILPVSKDPNEQVVLQATKSKVETVIQQNRAFLLGAIKKDNERAQKLWGCLERIGKEPYSETNLILVETFLKEAKEIQQRLDALPGEAFQAQQRIANAIVQRYEAFLFVLKKSKDSSINLSDALECIKQFTLDWVERFKLPLTIDGKKVHSPAPLLILKEVSRAGYSIEDGLKLLAELHQGGNANIASSAVRHNFEKLESPLFFSIVGGAQFHLTIAPPEQGIHLEVTQPCKLLNRDPEDLSKPLLQGAIDEREARGPVVRLKETKKLLNGQWENSKITLLSKAQSQVFKVLLSHGCEFDGEKVKEAVDYFENHFDPNLFRFPTQEGRARLSRPDTFIAELFREDRPKKQIEANLEFLLQYKENEGIFHIQN